RSTMETVAARNLRMSMQPSSFGPSVSFAMVRGYSYPYRGFSACGRGSPGGGTARCRSSSAIAYGAPVEELGATTDVLAAEGFSGAVRVDRDGGTVFAKAYGFADRERGIPNMLETRFGIASGTKGLTALTV